MQILHYSNVPTRQLGDEIRRTYQSDHVRIVETRIPPGHVQNEHRHDSLYDITFVVDGEIEVCERDGDECSWVRLTKGDVVVFSPGPYHNVANRSDAPAVMLTIKFVRPADLSSEAFAALCKTDWFGLDAAETRR